MSNIFSVSRPALEQFKTCLAEEAGQWDSGIELRGEPGSIHAYASAAGHLSRMVRPFVDPRLQIVALDAAFYTTGYFLHTVALLGQTENISQPQLRELAVGNDSCRTLLTPASTTLRMAHAIEGVAGMSATAWVSREKMLDEYKITDDGIAFKNTALTADRAADLGGISDEEVGEWGTLPKGRCPAPALGLIRPVLEAMVEVADTDPRLFAATLAPPDK